MVLSGSSVIACCTRLELGNVETSRGDKQVLQLT
jgi:hypothetical protein